MEAFLQIAVNAVITAAVYALVASGLSFIYATTRVFHLAHGFVIAASAFVFWWFSTTGGYPWILSGFGACAVAVLLGFLMNEFVYEPLRARKTKGLGYLVATVALLMFGNAAILAVFGAQPRSLGIQTHVFDAAGVRISSLQIGIVLAAAFLLSALAAFIRFTRFGKAMRATADNEVMAEVLGIHTRRVRRLTFAIGSFLGGVAGILMALEFNADPTMGVMFAIKGFSAMVLGGVASMPGAVVGSLALASVEQAAVWFWGSSWRNAIAFVLLFIVLLCKPARGWKGLVVRG
ncbi:branched-chain amino acid ABC transporter permease [Candidatus Uhrbacteria bacterium]|nr:branched-chain amino acid ABC transporter permease [Candidatus Uhrbacteria bacterium]